MHTITYATSLSYIVQFNRDLSVQVKSSSMLSLLLFNEHRTDNQGDKLVLRDCGGFMSGRQVAVGGGGGRVVPNFSRVSLK